MDRSPLPTLRIGFVGAGFIAHFHLQALTGVRNAIVSAVTSPRRERREALAARANEMGLGPCRAYDSISEWPTELRSLPLTLEAYGADRWIFARERPEPHSLEQTTAKLLTTLGVQYLHIRNTEAGCFIARVECWKPDERGGI